MVNFGFSKKKLKDKGLKFEIINNGENLSQGEKQLVSLMKVLFTKKKIIILDEATSSIDYDSEAKIMKTLYERIKDKTLITVAHRIKTVISCNQIIVLENGRIVESGKTNDLLLDQNSRFFDLYKKSTEINNKN